MSITHSRLASRFSVTSSATQAMSDDYRHHGGDDLVEGLRLTQDRVQVRPPESGPGVGAGLPRRCRVQASRTSSMTAASALSMSPSMVPANSDSGIGSEVTQSGVW